MKLNITTKKANTTGVQFRIDPDTKKKLTALKKFYGVGTGVLIKQLIVQSLIKIEEPDVVVL